MTPTCRRIYPLSLDAILLLKINSDLWTAELTHWRNIRWRSGCKKVQSPHRVLNVRPVAFADSTRSGNDGNDYEENSDEDPLPVYFIQYIIVFFCQKLQ